MSALESLFDEHRKLALTKGKPLKLRQATAIVIVVSGIVLLYTACGVHEALIHHTYLALLYCMGAFVILITLPIHIYNYLRVRKGTEVVNPLSLLVLLSGTIRVPLSIKLALVGSLTVLVAAVSYQSLPGLFLAAHVHRAFKLVMLIAGFNLFLWLVVALAWYLFVLTHKQKPSEVKSGLEQGLGVWPPAPNSGKDNGKG